MGYSRQWIVIVAYEENEDKVVVELPVVTSSGCEAKRKAVSVMRGLHPTATGHRVVRCESKGPA